MTVLLVPDDLWAAVEPRLPPEPPGPKGGRPRVDDRRALSGIVFVLLTGTPWEHLPREVAGCSGMTCWRRLRDWQLAGVWEAVRRALLDRLGRINAIDWRRGSLDSATVPAKRGAERPGGTRPTAASRAASATSRSTAAASRSPSP
jgi:transposase